MTTTYKGREIATTTSKHIAIAPPTPSMIPPMAPPTPTGVPAPFPHKGDTSTTSGAYSKLKIAKGKTTMKGMKINADPPDNQPSQPAPLHDLMTGKMNKKITVG